MLLSGYPDLLSYHRQTRTATDLKSRIQTVSTEAVTGLHDDISKVTRGNVGGAHLLKKALNDIDQNKRLNALSSSRIGMITQAITGAREAINNLDARATIALASGSALSMGVIISEAEVNIGSVLSALSARHGNRNLLSGDVTDTPPFASADVLLSDVRAIMTAGPAPTDIETALDSYFNDPSGGYQTNIYQGGDNPPPPLRLGNGTMLNVNVRGDDPSIKNALRGLAVIAAIDSAGYALDSPEYAELLNSGIASVTDGATAFITLESDLGIFTETIEKANSQDNFESLSLTAAYQSITVRDQFEAAAELQQLQVQLESAYLVTTKLADLTISNYIR